MSILWINSRKLVKSVQFAMRGLLYAWRSEQNFRIQILAGVIVLVVAFYFRVSFMGVVALVMMMTVVLVLELLNTFFEKLVDLLSPRLHHAVGILKDVLAAAVLVASLGAIIVGILIFWPYLRV